MFAGFALAYSILLATAGAIFCLIVAPFIGMHWYHWIISGLGMFFLAIGFVGMASESNFERSPGAANFWHGLFTLIVPPVAVCVLGIVPLAHAPLAGWLVPGLFLVIAWVFFVGAASGVIDVEPAPARRARQTTSTPAPSCVPHQPSISTNNQDITPGWRAWQERRNEIARSRRQR